ncbi:NAD(P)H-binding protein [Winogradskyella sp.]|uniref:NAD(P)H-binding protein n=1 Tax=Winogradskyella sp. TaxID=1883156 RepID=UPI00261605EE|nr:NAD(P)H-binding protein [Winogradskyella sp.]
MKEQISIIGCGWLGFPLAKTLITNGLKVKGSTTSEDKLKTIKAADIDAFLIRLHSEGVFGNYSEFLSGSTTVIINIPPGLRKNPEKNHVEELWHLIKAIEEQEVQNVLYISSTSVYKDDVHLPTISNSTSPDGVSNSVKQLIQIEKILQENTSFATTIIRFGGLFDEQRHPAKYLSGKQNIKNPEAPVNLIHKDDCIAIILRVISNNFWNLTLNAVYPEHPIKKEYYSAYCKRHNLAQPKFDSSKKSKGKIIDSSKLVQLLNYTFKHGL